MSGNEALAAKVDERVTQNKNRSGARARRRNEAPYSAYDTLEPQEGTAHYSPL